MKHDPLSHGLGTTAVHLATAQIVVRASAPSADAGVDFELVNEATGVIEDALYADACCARALRDWLVARYGEPEAQP